MSRRLKPSVGSFGASTQVIHHPGPWKSADAVEWETLKWGDWFNNRRLLESDGNIPPVEAERNFDDTIEGVNMVA